MDGIFNIYKEKGFTSHDVVAIVRRTIHMKKVGHTGTLDPDAEGVLPVCVGKATKLSDVIMDGRKSYRAMLRLGVTTTTEDASGEVLETKAVVFDEGKIRAAVAAFIGRLEQVPPMYSAVKVNGKKLYELAREGKEIARKARTIEVYDIRIRRFLPPDRVEMDIDCSKGTYIRTLCADIGKALGCGGHMAELLRTATGSFSLENAIKLDDLKALAEQERAEDALLTMQEARGLSRSEVIDALLTASGFGAVVMKNATVAGAEGGCQAECGVAAAMAAAAAVQLCGGTLPQMLS